MANRKGRSDIKKRFIEDRPVRIGYATFTAREVANAKLEIEPYPLTCYRIVDKTTGKIWSAGFSTEQDAKLVMETTNNGEITHFKRLIDLDNEDEMTRLGRIDLIKDGLRNV